MSNESKNVINNLSKKEYMKRVLIHSHFILYLQGITLAYFNEFDKDIISYNALYELTEDKKVLQF